MLTMQTSSVSLAKKAPWAMDWNAPSSFAASGTPDAVVNSV